MNYPQMKFEQVAFCFMMLYHTKELFNGTMEQFIERVCFDSIKYCHYNETDNSTYQKVNAVITLVCLERTGYILSNQHINDFQKYLEISENHLLFKNEEWIEYQLDLKTAIDYLEWSKEKNTN